MLFTISSNTGAAALAGGVQSFAQAKADADNQRTRQAAVRDRLDMQKQELNLTTEKLLREKEAMGEESAAALANAKILTGDFNSLDEMRDNLSRLPARLQGVAINGVKQMFGTPNEEGDVTLENWLKTLQDGDRSAKAKEQQRRMGGKLAGARAIVDEHPEFADRMAEGIELYTQTGDSSIIDEVIEDTSDLESASSKLQTSATSIRTMMQHPSVAAFARPGGMDEAAHMAAVLESLAKKDPFNDELIQAATRKAHEAMTSAIVRDDLEQLREREENNRVLLENFERDREQKAILDSGATYNVNDAQPEIGPLIDDGPQPEIGPLIDDGPQPLSDAERKSQFGQSTSGPRLKAWESLSKAETLKINRSIDNLRAELDSHPDIDMDKVPVDFQAVVYSAMLRDLHGVALPPDDFLKLRKYKGAGFEKRAREEASKPEFERVEGGNRQRRIRERIRGVMAEVGGGPEKAIGILQQQGYNFEEMAAAVDPGSEIGAWTVDMTDGERSAANQWRELGSTGIMLNEEMFAVARGLGEDTMRFVQYLGDKAAPDTTPQHDGGGLLDSLGRSLFFPLPGQ